MTNQFDYNDDTATRASMLPVISKRFFALALALVIGFPTLGVADKGDLIERISPAELGVPSAAMPDVKMKAGLLCAEDGRVLWSRRETDRRAMASITKIMTAIVAMENADLNEEVTISKSAKRTRYSSPFLQVGQRIMLDELLEASLVRSGNDAATALAEHVAGDEERFVAMMNAKAKELGLSRTRFVNPHGLDAKGHYSTAEDLAVLSRYAMRKPDFRRIVGQSSCTVSAAGLSEKADNTNVLIGNYEGANGVKTGWTDDAGHSVVVSAKRGGVELYAVVLGTSGETARFRAAKELLDWGFAHYREQRLASAGTVIGSAVVTDFLDVTVPAAVSRDATLAVFDLAGPITRTVNVVDVAAPIAKGDRVGVTTFMQSGRVIDTIPLVATVDVRAPGIFKRFGISIVRAVRRLRGQPTQASATEVSAPSQ